jgi:hypothetical protein
MSAELGQTRRPLPDVLWKVFGDPSNQWMLGVMLIGLVGAAAGPWSIIRFVSRQTSAVQETDAHTARE